MSAQKSHSPRFRAFSRVLAVLVALVVLAIPAAALGAVFDPLCIISDENWRASQSMSPADIQAFLDAQPSYLKQYSEPDATGTWHMASWIIWNACQQWGVNPKLVLATLDKEQSLISAPYHDATPTHQYGTEYHLTWAMGCGVPDSGNRNYAYAGFSNQIWYGTQKLGLAPEAGSTSPYAWYPGKQKQVTVIADRTKIWITPSNQPTWNAYTYTPWYPQKGVWTIYVRYFGDPLESPANKPVYRFYNTANGAHFYTASETERWRVQSVLGKTFRFEGVAYSVATSNTANCAPLYRFYNNRTKTHFYTASEAEKASVQARLASIYTFEGPAYNVSLEASGAAPVYRFYNRKLGTHFYTVSDVERDNTIAKLGWLYTYEGPAFYLAPPPPPPEPAASPTP